LFTGFVIGYLTRTPSNSSSHFTGLESRY